MLYVHLFVVEDWSRGTYFQLVPLVINCSLICCQIDETEVVIIGEEWFFDCVFDCFCLFCYGHVQIFCILSKSIENKNWVLDIYSCLLLQLLNTGDDLTSESLHLQLLILPHVQQHTTWINKYITFSPPMASCSLMLSAKNF